MMEQMTALLFWFNIITFALMVLTLGLVYLEYHKHRERWMRPYLAYHGVHVLWLLLATYVFFHEMYIAPASPPLTIAAGYGRTVLSLAIMWAGLTFHLSVARIDGLARHLVRDTVVAAVVVLAAGAVFLENAAMGIGANIVFDLAMAATAWSALNRTRSTPAGAARMTVPFLAFSILAYPAILAANVYIAVRGQPDNLMELNVLITGTFAFVWSLIMLVVVTRRFSGSSTKAEEVPGEAMVRDYRITPREREIIQELYRGATSRDIGERLFISQRTVETHTRNIYRKCGVSGRFGLIELVARYFGGSPGPTPGTAGTENR